MFFLQWWCWRWEYCCTDDVCGKHKACNWSLTFGRLTGPWKSFLFGRMEIILHHALGFHHITTRTWLYGIWVICLRLQQTVGALYSEVLLMLSVLRFWAPIFLYVCHLIKAYKIYVPCVWYLLRLLLIWFCYLVSGIWYMVVGILYLVFGIWYLLHGIWCLVSGIWYLIFGIWYFVYMVFGIWYMVRGIWCLVSCIRYLVSSIWHLVFGIWYLVFGI